MEKAARTTLRQLKEVCLRSLDPEKRGDQYYYNDVTTMVTVSTMALQYKTGEDVRSDGVTGTSQDSLCALLEAAALEGLQELRTQEIRSSDTQQTSPYTVRLAADDFWSHCHSLAQLSTNILKNPVQLAPFKQAISSLHRLSLGVSRLLEAFLSVGKAVLNEHQILTFLSHLHDKFWSQEAKRIAEQITLTKTEKYFSVENDDSITMLTRIMATLYCLFSVHDTVKTSLLVDHQNPDGESKMKLPSIQQNPAINQWLCRSVFNPLQDLLTTSAPKLLLSAYQSTLERDKESLHKEAEMGEMPEHIMAVNLLTSALHCMSKLVIKCSPSPSSDINVRDPLISSVTTETSLRLANHCWEELSQLMKKVPSELPANVLCLILASFVQLHSFLLCYNLPFSDEQKEAHTFILHALSESCEGLREQIISYHTQLCLTSLLHDASSQDWTNTKPFFEGERGSYTIQMWHYHMQGLRHDLCTLLAPTSYGLAEKILLAVLSASLAHLARRYSTATPSYARLNQFRADILSIFSTVMSLQPQLRHQNEADLSNQNSPEITLIHRSCNQLLNVLAIGACPLADLEEVLSQHSPSPTKKIGEGGDKDKTSEDDRYKSVLSESVKGCSWQWASALERHQAVLMTTHTTPPPAVMAGGEGTTLYGHELGTAAADVVMTMSWFPFMSKSGVCGTTGTQFDTRIWISTTQPNISPSLLQALLSNTTSLAVTLCLSDIATDDSLIVDDIVSLLSLCCHDEWALSNFYTKLKASLEKNSSQLQDRNLIKKEAVFNWLSRRLQIELERYVLSMATGLHGNLHDKAKIWQHLLSSLVGLGERLSKMDLPDSIINLIWTMADDVSKRDSCSDGAGLAKVVAFLVSRWPIYAHLRLPDGPLGASEPDSAHRIRLSDSTHHLLRLPDGPLGELMSAHLSSMVCALSGLKLSQCQGTPHIVKDVINSHLMELQSWLNQFNQFLPRARTHDEREEPTLAECEAVWEVISEDDVMVMSLERIHNAVVKWLRLRGGGSGGFNPQGEYNKVPSMEIVDNIDWKGLVDGVIVGGATTPTVCSILETVRWEFQDGSSSYLEEREIELTKAVRRYLHYLDDCTV